MIQDIAYNLYKNECKDKPKLSKYDFIFTSTLYVNIYHKLAKQEYRILKLKNIIK